MQHLGTKELQTERLILRRFAMDDAEAMYRNWCDDPEVTKYLCWPTHENVEVTRSVLAEWVSSYEKDDVYHWAIVLMEIGEPIGGISVVHRNDDIQMVHIGYCIGRRWWRQGVMTEAFAEVIRFLFEEVGVNRIEARHDVENPNSGKVMLKCGLKYEGTMRQAGRNNQGIRDGAFYGILAEDYFAE